MASSLGIASLTNLKTGVQVSAALSGIPQGPLLFWMARQPDITTAVEVPYTGAGPFTLTAPYAGLWYCWASDNNGFMRALDEQGNPYPPACWVGVSNDPLGEELGKYVRDTLIQNRAGIEAVYRTRYPNGTIKQILYGFGGNTVDYPAITVAEPVISWAWIAFPYSKRYTYTVNIGGWIEHTTEQPEVSSAMLLVDGVMEVLNNPIYNHLRLPSGRYIYNVATMKGEARESVADDNKFLSVASLVWSANMQRQDKIQQA